MSDAAAFSATYADFKLIKTRGVVQIALEAPIEKAMEILEVLGGMPRAAEERWFAIARLNIGGAAHTPRNLTIDNASERVARPLNPLPQRAAQLCNEPQFRLWLERTYLPSNNQCNSEEDAAEIVRHLCDVKSRADIKPGTAAADKFDRLVGNFLVWKNADRYVEAPRVQQENQT